MTIANGAPLTEVKCNSCHDSYAVLGATDGQPKLRHSHQLFFVCRRCRLVELGEYVEELLEAGPAHFGLDDSDVEAFSLQALAAVLEYKKELFK